jgi:hypothetical protein
MGGFSGVDPRLRFGLVGVRGVMRDPRLGFGLVGVRGVMRDPRLRFGLVGGGGPPNGKPGRGIVGELEASWRRRGLAARGFLSGEYSGSPVA